MNATLAWYKAAEPHELEDGQVVSALAGGKAIALIRRGAEYGALEDRCPHAGGPLSQGCLEDGLLVCPWHGREFDPFTGQCAGFPPASALRVEVREEGIFVEA